MSVTFLCFATASLLFALLCSFWWEKDPMVDQQQIHKYTMIPSFLTADEHRQLQDFFESAGSIETVIYDFPSKIRQSIGEDQVPEPVTGECTDFRLTFNPKSKTCVFFPRVDVTINYFMYGSIDNKKETISTLINRVNYFMRHYNLDDIRIQNISAAIFKKTDWKSATASICPVDRPYYRQFTNHFNIMLPGQTLPYHFDGPYFLNGGTRVFLPQWLLIVMAQSKLFEDDRIPAIQEVFYIHGNSRSDEKLGGGDFLIHDRGIHSPPTMINVNPRDAIFCDGTQVVHGVSPSSTAISDKNTANIALTKLSKNEKHKLLFDSSDRVWRLYSNDKLREGHYFSWEEIRASLVYHGWCFADEESMRTYNPSTPGKYTLEVVLQILVEDLVSKGVIKSDDEANRMSRYDLGVLLMDQYVHYPVPNHNRNWITFNYCVLFEMMPNIIKHNYLMNIIQNSMCD